AWTGEDEHVRETGDGQPQVGTWSRRPFLAQLPAVATADVDAIERAGHGVEAGGEDQHVHLVGAALGPHTGLGDLLNRGAPQVDQGAVVPVVGLEVAAVGDEALGADRVIVGDQLVGEFLIVHQRADLGLDVLAGGVVGGQVGGLV